MSAARAYRPSHGGRPDVVPSLAILGRRFAHAIRLELERTAAACNELLELSPAGDRALDEVLEGAAGLSSAALEHTLTPAERERRRVEPCTRAAPCAAPCYGEVPGCPYVRTDVRP